MGKSGHPAVGEPLPVGRQAVRAPRPDGRHRAGRGRSRRPSPAAADHRSQLLRDGLAAEERDEHQLLGSVLTTILATSELPQNYVPEQFRGLTPVSVDIATSAQRKPGDFVSILDGQLKPGLEVKVTLELDIIPWREAGP